MKKIDADLILAWIRDRRKSEAEILFMCRKDGHGNTVGAGMSIGAIDLLDEIKRYILDNVNE